MDARVINFWDQTSHVCVRRLLMLFLFKKGFKHKFEPFLSVIKYLISGVY